MIEGELISSSREIERRPEKEEYLWLPIVDVARGTGYSEVRLRHLAKSKRIASEKELRKQGEKGWPWRYRMRIIDVKSYKQSLPSFSELGKKEPKKGKRKRGRPRRGPREK